MKKKFRRRYLAPEVKEIVVKIESSILLTGSQLQDYEGEAWEDE